MTAIIPNMLHRTLYESRWVQHPSGVAEESELPSLRMCFLQPNKMLKKIDRRVKDSFVFFRAISPGARFITEAGLHRESHVQLRNEL